MGILNGVFVGDIELGFLVGFFWDLMVI